MASEEKSKKEKYVQEALKKTPFAIPEKIILTSKIGVSYIISEETYERNKEFYGKSGFYMETDPVKIKMIMDNQKGHIKK